MPLDNWENKIYATIEGFPEPYRDEILELFTEWIDTNPEPPLYSKWEDFSAKIDDRNALYTEKRVYLKRVKNDIRDLEIPPRKWQKVAKVLAAVASVFLVIFLAISRVFRGAE